MKKIIKFITRMYRQVIRSIAFYPVLISLFYGILALIALSLDNWEIVHSIKKNVPYLFIQDYETARSILSVLIGGVISLTVFSFSMVMVVLGQASSNFSPRLLPGLISNSEHQIILGIYVGTLLYCIIILTSLGALGMDTDTIGLSTMLAAILSVICIALFVYFIHNISGAIQIHNIIDRIFSKCNDFAERELKQSITLQISTGHTETSEWKVLRSDRSGYVRGIDTRIIKDSIKAQNNQIEIIPYPNMHVWKGKPILRIQKDLSKEEIKNLMLCMDISSNRYENDYGIGGMIKLMEIAVKAMSPGINDPGTAIDTIEKLGGLLRKFLQFPQKTAQALDKGQCVLIKNNIPAKELMRTIIQPIRFYAKQDNLVLYELIDALRFIAKCPNLCNENSRVVKLEINSLRKDIEYHIVNSSDRNQLLAKFE